MYIRFFKIEDDDIENARMIHSVDYIGDYSECVKALKVVDSINIDDFYYDLDFIAFNPAETNKHANTIDVYVKEP